MCSSNLELRPIKYFFQGEIFFDQHCLKLPMDGDNKKQPTSGHFVKVLKFSTDNAPALLFPWARPLPPSYLGTQFPTYGIQFHLWTNYNGELLA